VAGVAPGGDEGAAVARGLVVAGALAGEIVEVGDIVPGELDPAVEDRDVDPVVGGAGEAGAEARGDALDLLPVLGLELGPEHTLGRAAEEGPVTLRRALEELVEHAQGVVDLRGQE